MIDFWGVPVGAVARRIEIADAEVGVPVLELSGNDLALVQAYAMTEDHLQEVGVDVQITGTDKGRRVLVFAPPGTYYVAASSIGPITGS